MWDTHRIDENSGRPIFEYEFRGRDNKFICSGREMIIACDLDSDEVICTILHIVKMAIKDGTGEEKLYSVGDMPE